MANKLAMKFAAPIQPLAYTGLLFESEVILDTERLTCSVSVLLERADGSTPRSLTLSGVELSQTTLKNLLQDIANAAKGSAAAGKDFIEQAPDLPDLKDAIKSATLEVRASAR